MLRNVVACAALVHLENFALYCDVNLHITCSSLLCIEYFYGDTKINVAHVYYHFNQMCSVAYRHVRNICL